MLGQVDWIRLVSRYFVTGSAQWFEYVGKGSKQELGSFVGFCLVRRVNFIGCNRMVLFIRNSSGFLSFAVGIFRWFGAHKRCLTCTAQAELIV